MTIPEATLLRSRSVPPAPPAPPLITYSSRGAESFIRIGSDLGPALAAFIEQRRFYRLCVITDTAVGALYGDRLRDELAAGTRAEQRWYAIAPGEGSKTLPAVYECLEEILPFMTRDSVIVAFGGGVVGNFGGTVAALLYRGTPFIHLPTTFMAQADSAIGLKQAVNGTRTKNAYGAYHMPLAVYDDIRYLGTLPRHEWRNGLAESVKVAVAASPRFVDTLLRLAPRVPHFSDEEMYLLLTETITPKVNGLAGDPQETSSLMFLELGHAVGHAIERATQGSVPHGTAIALGMLIETTIGMRLGISDRSVYDIFAELFTKLGFPRRLPAGLDPRRVTASLQCGTRRLATGPIFVFARTPGHTATVSGVDPALVDEVLDAFASTTPDA